MGVMPDSIKVVTVFIIAGVGAFDSVNLALQPIFHSGIVVFHRHKVAVLRRVGRSDNAVHAAGKHSRTRGQPCKHKDNEKQRGNGDKHPYGVAHDERRRLPCFFCGFGCRPAGVLYCAFDTLCAAVLCRLCILPFYLLFLPKAGNGIARKLRVIVQCLVILEIDICLCRRFFGFRRLAVGFELVAAVALFELPCPVLCAFFRCFLGFVRPLHAGIVFLNGMYLVMDENPGFLRGTG